MLSYCIFTHKHVYSICQLPRFKLKLLIVILTLEVLNCLHDMYTNTWILKHSIKCILTYYNLTLLLLLL